MDSGEDAVPVANASANEDRTLRHRALHSFWGKLALELFVVFIGVSGAFALEGYRADRERAELRRALYGALDNELSNMTEKGPTFNREATGQLDAWDRAVARGVHPLPPTFRIPIERPPTGVWDAAVQSNAIDLIEPSLFFEVASFYNRVDSLATQFQRYSVAAEQDVWPRLRDGPRAFWSSNGQLRPEIATHVLRLRNWRQQQAMNTEEASSLRARIRNAAKD